MLKKTMMLATMAAAIAALSVPASALAVSGHWSMGGAELTESGMVTITTEGFKTKFTSVSGQGGVECHVTITVDLKASSDEGEITTFEPIECESFGTLHTVCGAVKKVESTGLPWPITATHGGVIDIEKTIIDNELNGGIFCPNGGHINITGVTPGNHPTGTLNSTTAATTATLGGRVETSVGEAKAEGSGTFTQNSGTYGIL